MAWQFNFFITPRQKAPPVKTGMNGAGSGFAQANPAGKEATPVKAWSFTRHRRMDGFLPIAYIADQIIQRENIRGADVK
jgi:hypothetical protein